MWVKESVKTDAFLSVYVNMHVQANVLTVGQPVTGK